MENRQLALMMDLAILLASVNSVLLVILLVLYGRIFAKRRATYALGLMIFAFFLLLQNGMTAYSYASMSSYFGEAVLPFLLGMSLLELGGLVALFKITL